MKQKQIMVRQITTNVTKKDYGGNSYVDEITHYEVVELFNLINPTIGTKLTVEQLQIYLHNVEINVTIVQ